MAASYPTSLKIFRTYTDYSDLIMAQSVNELHDEIVSIETVLGPNPFSGTPYATVGGGLQDLYNNKAQKYHLHSHSSLPDDASGDDHFQYMRVDGSRGFTAPVTAPPAQTPWQLVTKGQVDSYGYIDSNYAMSLIQQMTANVARGALSGNGPLMGPSPWFPNWKVTAGLMAGVTDARGYLACSFGTAFNSTVQAFVATKLPVGAGGPAPPYNYVEAQITLVIITLGGATVAFSHDYSFQPHLYAAYSWIAIGL